MPRVLVTGAGGFVGRATIRSFVSSGWQTLAVSSQSKPPALAGAEWASLPGFGSIEPWVRLCKGVDAVVHLAAKAHVPESQARQLAAEFEAVNVRGTALIASAAAQARVPRFVFVSSIGVNGNRTSAKPFSIDSLPAPEGTYASSKHRAEQALWQVAGDTGLEVTVVRPVLVVGADAPGNLARLAQLVRRRVPIPLACCDNRRSFIDVDELASLLHLCATAPAVAGKTLLAAQDPPLSTVQVVRHIAEGLGMHARLWPLPPRALRLLASAAGQRDAAARLLDCLVVDAQPAHLLAQWQPQITIAESFRRLGVSCRSPRVGL